jgi:hypothetical protein
MVLEVYKNRKDYGPAFPQVTVIHGAEHVVSIIFEKLSSEHNSNSILSSLNW